MKMNFISGFDPFSSLLQTKTRQ